MEKNGRIILIDKELSEGQQKLSRYITHYTLIPFTGSTFKEWQTWVDLNKPYADHEKAKENASRDETTVRKHKPHDKKRGKEIACDADILYQVIREIGETNTHVCALCGFGHSYLSEIKKRGWLYESDIDKLALLNIDPGDYVTDAYYRAKHELDKVDPIPEPVQETQTTNISDDEMFQLIIDFFGLTKEDVIPFRTKAARYDMHPIVCIHQAILCESVDLDVEQRKIFPDEVA